MLGLASCAAPVIVFGLGDWIVRGYWSLLPEFKVVRQVTVGGTTLLMLTKSNPEEFGEAVDVIRNGKRARLAEGRHVYAPGDVEGLNPTQGAVDVTGDGIPDIVVLTLDDVFQGTLIVYDTKASQVPLAKIDCRGSLFKVVDSDGDGIFEIQLTDETLNRWRDSSSMTALPSVVLRWQRGRFTPDPRYMLKPSGLTRAETDTQAAAVKSMGATPGGWSAPSLLWSIMLQLLYSGQAKEAWAFLDLSWPDDAKETKEEFRRAFMEQLARSPYWADVEKFVDQGRSTTPEVK